MRKTAIFILAITLCALLSGCGKAMTVSLPFAASDVENVEMYHYVVPASAEKKIITQADAISELYAVFSELPVSDRKTEPVVGGAVTSFRFNLSDHTSYEIIYCAEAVKKGRLKLPAEQQDYFTSADIGGCWDGCAYEAVDTGESELPTYSSKPRGGAAVSKKEPCGTAATACCSVV